MSLRFHILIIILALVAIGIALAAFLFPLKRDEVKVVENVKNEEAPLPPLISPSKPNRTALTSTSIENLLTFLQDVGAIAVNSTSTESKESECFPPKEQWIIDELRRQAAKFHNKIDALGGVMKEQQVRINYGQVEYAILIAMRAMRTYSNTSSPSARNKFVNAAATMPMHVAALLGGLVDRHGIVEIISNVHHCNTAAIKRRVGELMMLATFGVIVDEEYNQLINATCEEREPVRILVHNSMEQVEKRLVETLDECRQLKSVSSEMMRLLEVNSNGTRQKVLNEIYEFLSSRYDRHDWLVVVYDSSDRPRPQLDFTFYKVEKVDSASGLKYTVAALPIIRAIHRNQARRWLIDRLCPPTRKQSKVIKFDIDRVQHNYNTYHNKHISLILGDDMHFATFRNATAIWRHSANMDIAQWPHRQHFCHLGNEELVLLAVAPSYKIPRDAIPSTSMALMNRYGYALTTAPNSTKIWADRFTGTPGQRWKFVNSQLHNDLGLCASVRVIESQCAEIGCSLRKLQLQMVPCSAGLFWQLDNMRLTNLQFGAFDQMAKHLDLDSSDYSAGWFFSMDGRVRYQEESSSSVAGHRLVNGFGFVLTVSDPFSGELLQDEDRNSTGQRWRFEGRRLMNDWNNCLVVYSNRIHKWLEQAACDLPTKYESSWVYQDEQIRNGRGLCLGVQGNKDVKGTALVEETCWDGRLGQRWILDNYKGPQPPQKILRTPSRALVNGFDLVVTVKDNYGDGWHWLNQETYQGHKGQLWSFDGHRILNDFGFCLKSSTNWWIYQDHCAYADAWYPMGKQLRNAKGCLGVHKNVATNGTWLVVEDCDAGKLGQMWTFELLVIYIICSEIDEK